jgi:hypothetical protein
MTINRSVGNGQILIGVPPGEKEAGNISLFGLLGDSLHFTARRSAVGEYHQIRVIQIDGFERFFRFPIELVVFSFLDSGRWSRAISPADVQSSRQSQSGLFLTEKWEVNLDHFVIATIAAQIAPILTAPLRDRNV